METRERVGGTFGSLSTVDLNLSGTFGSLSIVSMNLSGAFGSLSIVSMNLSGAFGWMLDAGYLILGAGISMVIVFHLAEYSGYFSNLKVFVNN